MFTRQHYKAIAEIIEKTTIEAGQSQGTIAKRSFVTRLTNYFAQDNPRFDRARFLAACGLDHAETDTQA